LYKSPPPPPQRVSPLGVAILSVPILQLPQIRSALTDTTKYIRGEYLTDVKAGVIRASNPIDKLCKLHGAAREECVASDEERVGALERGSR